MLLEYCKTILLPFWSSLLGCFSNVKKTYLPVRAQATYRRYVLLATGDGTQEKPSKQAPLPSPPARRRYKYAQIALLVILSIAFFFITLELLPWGHSRVPKKLNFAMAPKKTDFFVGRHKQIDALAKDFNKQDKLVILPPITGPLEHGKTQLALQLAAQHAAKYHHVVWIDATTISDIEASYLQIAKELGIKPVPNKNPSKAVELVQNELKSKHVLYVFDNAPNLVTIQPYLQKGHVLITSRNSATEDWASAYGELTPLTLAPFSNEEALQLANAMGLDTTNEDLAALIPLLPKYPLVITPLLSLMCAHMDTIPAFLKAMKDKNALIQQLKKTPPTHTAYIYLLRTYEDIYPRTADLLIADAFNNLGRIYDGQEQDNAAIDCYHEALDILEETKDDNLQKADTASIYNNLGTVYFHQHQYNNAIYCYLDALAILEAIYQDKQHLDIATTCQNLGAAYSKKNDYNSAIGYYNDALDIFKKIYDTKLHPDIATTYQNLGDAYHSRKDYDDAATCYEQAFHIFKKAYGDTPHPDIATTYNHLGNLYYAQKQYDEAIASYLQALDILQEAYHHTPHPDITATYRRLMYAYLYKWELKTAFTYWRKK